MNELSPAEKDLVENQVKKITAQYKNLNTIGTVFNIVVDLVEFADTYQKTGDIKQQIVIETVGKICPLLDIKTPSDEEIISIIKLVIYASSGYKSLKNSCCKNIDSIESNQERGVRLDDVKIEIPSEKYFIKAKDRASFHEYIQTFIATKYENNVYSVIRQMVKYVEYFKISLETKEKLVYESVKNIIDKLNIKSLSDDEITMVIKRIMRGKFKVNEKCCDLCSCFCCC